jgi:hypothetical protein
MRHLGYDPPEEPSLSASNAASSSAEGNVVLKDYPLITSVKLEEYFNNRKQEEVVVGCTSTWNPHTLFTFCKAMKLDHYKTSNSEKMKVAKSTASLLSSLFESCLLAEHLIDDDESITPNEITNPGSLLMNNGVNFGKKEIKKMQKKVTARHSCLQRLCTSFFIGIISRISLT